MKRISVVGTSCSGKTTIAKKISKLQKMEHFEMDALHWLPDWQESPTDILRQRVQQALIGDSWVIDGNYSKVRDIIWSRADTVVWLDYPFWLVFSRLLRRGIKRVVTKEELWGSGNRETWRTLFIGSDSMMWWVIKTYRKRKREYPILFAQAEYSHLEIIHLHSQKETDNWLETL
jgi:adenylate kinase family enzyme